MSFGGFTSQCSKDINTNDEDFPLLDPLDSVYRKGPWSLRRMSYGFFCFCLIFFLFFFSWAFSKTFKRRDRLRSLVTTENAFSGRDSVVDLNAAKRANVLLNYF